LAISREANSKADPSLNPEQLKKLQDKIEKCKQDVLKVNPTVVLLVECQPVTCLHTCHIVSLLQLLG
jgi:hypothetical protein